ncbi:MAG: hypothetical protein N2513_04045 [Deltaproteobacteria bacterium]|nr:hypothetical protein [Deltaproteobacteria bacterium]
MKVTLKLVLFLLPISVFLAERTVFSVSRATDCYGTLEAWKIDRSLKWYMDAYDCYCPSPSSRPVCTPKKSSSSQSSYNYSMPSTGNWKVDLMAGLFASFMNGFIKGLKQNQEAMQKVASKDVSQRHLMEEKKKNWEEEWRRNIETQLREAINSYKGQRQMEFENTKTRLLGNIKLPADSKIMKSLLCSRYWSKEAEKVVLLSDPFAHEKALAFNKKAELALSGDLRECPEEIVSIVDVDSHKVNLEFRNDFLSLVSLEEKGRLEILGSVKEGVSKLKREVEEIKNKIDALKEESEKSKNPSLLEEALKNLKEAEENLAKADVQREILENEIRAIQEIKRTIQTFKGDDK